jgi:hypothetical protein
MTPAKPREHRWSKLELSYHTQTSGHIWYSLVTPNSRDKVGKGDCLKIVRVAADVLNKRSRTAYKVALQLGGWEEIITILKT